jgi:putative phage-type endonuclease
MAIVLATTKDMPHAEWSQLRRMGIGGSDASVVCGINRFKSQMELWLEKTGQLPHQVAGEAAYWGNQLEPIVRREFTQRTGIEVRTTREMLQSETHPFMLANLDGECTHPEYGPCVFEAKTANAYRSKEWEHGVPVEYMLQVQHYMSVTGFMSAYVAVLIGGNTFKWFFVKRDDELISAIIRIETEFWNRVQNFTPPPLDGSEACTRFMNGRYPKSTTTTITLPASAATLLRQYDDACEKMEQLTTQKQEAENLLKEMLGEHEVGIMNDRIVTWKSVIQERLDSKALKAAHPEFSRQFTTTTSYRRFCINYR